MQYSAAFRSSVDGGLGSGQPIFEIQSSMTDYARITRIELELNTAFFTQTFAFGLGLPAAVGIFLGNSSFPFSPYNPSSPTCGVIAGVNWTTPPTAPAKFFRRVTILTPGATSTIPKTVFSFPPGLGISPASSMVLWMLAGSGNPTFVAPFEINIEIEA